MEHLTHEEIRKQFHYEPSQHIDDFHLAGFAYYDGLDVIDELTLGQRVTMVKEINNPYDEKAVAIYYKNKSLVIFLPAITHLFPHSFIMVTAISLKQEFKW